MNSSIWIAIALAVLATFVGCSDRAQQGSTHAAAVALTPAAKPLVAEPSLRAVLPENAIAYLRVPNPWGFLAAPKGTYLSAVLGSAENTNIVERLRSAVKTAIGGQLSTKADAFYSLLLFQLRSPVELAVLRPLPSDPPMPSVLLSASLAVDNVDAANGLLKTLTAQSPSLSITQDMDPERAGIIRAGPSAVYVHFDASSHVLYAMAGLGVTEKSFNAELARLKPAKDRRMYAFEEQIDASHQGFFEWINVKAMTTDMAPFLPPAIVQKMREGGMDQVADMAFGWGASQGKGRLRLIVDVPGAHFDRFVPSVSPDLPLATVGNPRTLVALAMPSAAQLEQLEHILRAKVGAQAFAGYQAAAAKFKASSGLSYADVLATLGPEVLFFSDRAGEFVAVRIRDQARLTHLLDALRRIPGSDYQVQKSAGHEYHMLRLPSLMAGAFERAGAEKIPPWIRLWARGKSHIYWTVEDGYLLISGLPQPLKDHLEHHGKQSIGKWVLNHQRQQLGSSLMLASTTIDDSPRRLYYAYVSLLGTLGDIAGVNVDLASLPSAMDLHLPRRGTYGLRIQADASRLGIELTFENNPMEILLGQNMASVAAVGVLAAVAIPAYQDYVMRSIVAAALADTAHARDAVDRFYARQRRFPDREEIAAMEGLNAATKNNRITIAPANGVIVITFTGYARLNGKHVWLQPSSGGDGQLRWRCGGDVEPKYLPAVCR